MSERVEGEWRESGCHSAHHMITLGWFLSLVINSPIMSRCARRVSRTCSVCAAGGTRREGGEWVMAELLRA